MQGEWRDWSSEREEKQFSQNGDWTEVWFSYWQPLRDNQTEMWPRSQSFMPTSSSFHFLSQTVESLSKPSMSSCLKQWPGYGIQGSLYPVFLFSFLSPCWPTNASEHTGSGGGLACQSITLSSTKRESLYLLCAPTISKLIWAMYSRRDSDDHHLRSRLLHCLLIHDLPSCNRTLGPCLWVKLTRK